MRFTTVEYKSFSKNSEKLLGKGENVVIAEHLAENPKLGELIKETGGIRKLQWPLCVKNLEETRGLVYYYYKDRTQPIYLISVYKPKTKQVLSKLIQILVST